MKIKHKLMIFLLILPMTVFCQIKQDKRFLSGDFNTNLNLAEGELSNRSLGMGITFGRFSKTDLARGLSVYAGASKNSLQNANSYENWRYGVTPFFQKFKMFNDKWGISGKVTANLGVSNTKLNTTVNEYITQSIGLNFSASPGIIYFLSEQWALQANVGSLDVANLRFITNQQTSGSDQNQYKGITDGTELEYSFAPTLSLGVVTFSFTYFLK